MKNANKTSQNITPPPHAKNVNNSSIFSHIKSYFKNLKRSKNNVEHGRSMVEMLGVLAIIGVLSIGAIAGYTVAMNRHKANQIFDSATKLSVAAQTGSATHSNNWQGPVQDMFRQIGGTLYSQDAHAVAGGVYEATLEVLENGMVLGYASVNGVQAALNSLVGRDDYVLIGGDNAVSGGGTNTPSEPSNPSEPVTDPLMEPVTEPEETQTQTETTLACGANEIGVNGICYSCSQFDPISASAKSDLQGCSNRSVVGNGSDWKSYLKSCPSGYTETGMGYCFDGEVPINDGSYEGANYPSDCCKQQKCSGSTPLEGDDGNCYSCTTSTPVSVFSNALRCESTCPNRVLNADVCALPCESGYFMDVNGNCQSCYTSEEVYVDPVQNTGQCDRCSNRTLNGNLCVLK